MTALTDAHSTPSRGDRFPVPSVGAPTADAPDPVVERLQARIDGFEAQPHTLPDRRPKPVAPATDPSPTAASVEELAAQVADLNAQLELLRHQLDAAFDEVDAAIASAHAQAERAEIRAAASDARAGDVLAGVEALARHLDGIATRLPPADTTPLRASLDRLRARMAER